MSSSRPEESTSFLKSTFQELKQSVVNAADRLTGGDSFKSTAQPLKEDKIGRTVKKGDAESKDTVAGGT